MWAKFCNIYYMCKIYKFIVIILNRIKEYIYKIYSTYEDEELGYRLDC